MSICELKLWMLVVPGAGGCSAPVKNLCRTSLMTMPCAKSACQSCGDIYVPLGGGNNGVGSGTGITCRVSGCISTCPLCCAGCQLIPPSVLISVNTSKKQPIMYPPATGRTVV